MFLTWSTYVLTVWTNSHLPKSLAECFASIITPYKEKLSNGSLSALVNYWSGSKTTNLYDIANYKQLLITYTRTYNFFSINHTCSESPFIYKHISKTSFTCKIGPSSKCHSFNGLYILDIIHKGNYYVVLDNWDLPSRQSLWIPRVAGCLVPR